MITGNTHAGRPEALWRRRIGWRHALAAAVWILVVARVGSEFSGRGARYWHCDLAAYFHEQGTFYRAVYPHANVAPPVRGIGAVYTDFPPHSFWLMGVLVPPCLGWSGTQAWFGACQLLALAVVIGFAWRMARGAAPGAAWLLAGSVAAMTGLRADLLFGNVGVLMTAMLVGLYWGLSGNRWRFAGALWLASMMKPQMGWLFAWSFLQRKGWPALAGALAAMALLATATCLWTGVTPLEIARSAYFSRLMVMMSLGERHSLPSLLVRWGAAPRIALALSMLGGMGAVGWAWHGRLVAAETLTRMAFVGVVNRVCTYHNACDDLLLVFALVLLGRRAWLAGTKAEWAAFLVLGGTVWMPTAGWQWPGANAFEVAVWILLAGWIAFRKETIRAAGLKVGSVARSSPQPFGA